MGRRTVKEYRAAEALALIAADRDHRPLACPSCGAARIERTPPHNPADPATQLGRITLRCLACGRVAVYLAQPETVETTTAPTPRPH